MSLTLAIINGVVSWHRYNGVRITVIFASMTVGFAFAYWLMAVLAHGWTYARHIRNAQASGLRLRAQLSEAARRRAEAQLRALKTELNPHFVGNALNAVSSLMRTDLAAADHMLAQVAELLRTTFAHTGTQEVTLREELEQLEPFLAVERARLGQPLEVRWNVDERALGGRVPHMILQPLLENAVRHGLAPRQGVGHIEVAARRGDGRLELLVRDDGIGLTEVPPRTRYRSGGVGLSNTRARLTELYGGAASLELFQDTAGGAIARLSIPWREFDASNTISGINAISA
jgi:LytS/YehU family sensor histidine kinase